jgi:hypothetical protein
MALLFGSVVLRAVNAFRQRPQLAALNEGCGLEAG